MPKLTKKLTDTVARSIEIPALQSEGKTVQVVWWCPVTPGFGLRVSSSGAKVYYSLRRVDGKLVPRNCGKAVGPGAVSAEAARKVAQEINNELLLGVDRIQVRREEKKVELEEAVTFGEALKEFVEKGRRGKDGLEHKSRTASDYLKMIRPAGIGPSGPGKRPKPWGNGRLFTLADKPIASITAADILKVDALGRKTSQRQADYAMQILRAVLNWHGIVIEGSPLAKATAGKKRIVISGVKKKGRPIPRAQLGAWWNAAVAHVDHGRPQNLPTGAADGLRFMLLTGLRPGEVFGSAWQPGMYVKDVNFAAKMLTSFDTKNRSDFNVMLSKQALAILKKACTNKLPAAKVFDVKDPGKTLETINELAGVQGITPHKLRHTFASICEPRVSGYMLKRMINHISDEDVTGGYVGKDEEELAEGWQVVADFITSAAAEAAQAAASQPVSQAAA